MTATDSAAADTAPEATDTTPTTTDAGDGTAPDTGALQAEVEKWKALAKKHEERAKGNASKASELERIQREQMTEQERAITEAREAAFAEGRAAGLAREVAAEVRAAAANRIADIDALLEGLDTAKFVTEDGEADTRAIEAWVDRIAPKRTDEGPLGAGIDIGQGMGPTNVGVGDDDGIENLLRDAVGLPRKR